ncbi:MAG: diguanylate cyclase [Candidatus Aminicenantaceae bacterium]
MAYIRYFDDALAQTRKKFLQLKIAHKMLLGFLPLFILTVLMAAYALTSLTRLNRINRSIIDVDIPLIQAAGVMIDKLYDQELHGNLYVLLKSNQNLTLFHEAGSEFKNRILAIKGLTENDAERIERLSDRHDEYQTIFEEWFNSAESTDYEPLEFEIRIETKQEELKNLIEDISGPASSGLEDKTLAASLIGSTSSKIFAVFCVISMLIGFVAAYAITRNISGAIIRLKNATQEISKGNFDYTPEFNNQDELGELSMAFSEMAKRLKRLEEMYLDTSPLTHLPGGIAIENILKKRIEGGLLFAFCLIDLDNFKAYNDHYGYARGNQVIKNTAQIIEKAVKKYDSEEAFFGHIGGDDFVVITSIDLYAVICKTIVEEFDKSIDDLYDSKDLNLGHIIRKSRLGEENKFPIMTISIGVVTNKKRKFKHFVQVGEIAAEVKNYAKSKPGSLYYVDRRKNEA